MGHAKQSEGHGAVPLSQGSHRQAESRDEPTSPSRENASIEAAAAFGASFGSCVRCMQSEDAILAAAERRRQCEASDSPQIRREPRGVHDLQLHVL